MAIYRDIDLNFGIDAIDGDINVSEDAIAVARAMKNLILTGPGESHFHPEIYSDFATVLFSPMNNITALALKSNIEKVLELYEPRANVREVLVSVNSENEGYNITITYSINREENQTYEFSTLLNRESII